MEGSSSINTSLGLMRADEYFACQKSSGSESDSQNWISSVGLMLRCGRQMKGHCIIFLGQSSWLISMMIAKIQIWLQQQQQKEKNGPDGTGDYRSKLPQHTHYVGTASSALESSSDAAYLWRPAPYNLLPMCHKCFFVGEIGWGMDRYLHQIGRYRTKLMMLEPLPPLEEYELINQYSNPRWKIPRPPPDDPQFFSWASFPTYYPSVPIMARSQQSLCQVKS